MKFTKGQLKDLEEVESFIPKHPANTYLPITDEDRKKYLERSERGLHKEIKMDGKYIGFIEGIGSIYEFSGFQQLMWGKVYRERTINNEWSKSSKVGYGYSHP